MENSFESVTPTPFSFYPLILDYISHQQAVIDLLLERIPEKERDELLNKAYKDKDIVYNGLVTKLKVAEDYRNALKPGN